jgi:ABC-type transport system substrate-binding protein
MRKIHFKRGAAAAGAVLAAVVLAAWPAARPSAEDAPRYGGVLRVREDGVAPQPNLDPAVHSWTFATEQLFEGLVRLNAKLDIVPALAEYWINSEDGRKMTFILKRGVKFHNGREMNSLDVKFSLERLLRRDIQSPYAQLFMRKVSGAQEFWDGKAEDVSGFRTPEKFVFEIQWKDPYVSALYLLSMSFCKILPRDLLLDQGRNFFWQPVGTGPFKFDSWIRSPRLDVVGVRLDRFSQYHDRRPYLDAVEFSPHFSVDQFMDGDVHVMPFLSERMATSRSQIVQGGLYNMTFLMMSCQNPPLDSAAVRLAVAAAVDKDKLALAWGGPAGTLRSSANFIPPGLPGFVPIDDRLSGDPERARRLLADFGYLVERPFPELLFFIPLPRSDATVRMGRELETQLEAIGIPISVRYISSPAALRDVKQPYLAFIPWRMDFPDAENIIQPLFTSGSEFNRAACRYDSPEFDKLFDEAEVEKSWTRRVDLFRRMERLLVRDAPALPLFFAEDRFAVQGRVHGLKIPVLGFSYLDTRFVWLEKKEPGH